MMMNDANLTSDLYGDDPFFEEDYEEQEPDLPEETDYCPRCGENRHLTGKNKVNRDRQDPTLIYELTCGHWVI